MGKRIKRVLHYNPGWVFLPFFANHFFFLISYFFTRKPIRINFSLCTFHYYLYLTESTICSMSLIFFILLLLYKTWKSNLFLFIHCLHRFLFQNQPADYGRQIQRREFLDPRRMPEIFGIDKGLANCDSRKCLSYMTSRIPHRVLPWHEILQERYEELIIFHFSGGG